MLYVKTREVKCDYFSFWYFENIKWSWQRLLNCNTEFNTNLSCAFRVADSFINLNAIWKMCQKNKKQVKTFFLNQATTKDLAKSFNCHHGNRMNVWLVSKDNLLFSLTASHVCVLVCVSYVVYLAGRLFVQSREVKISTSLLGRKN